MKPNQAGAKSKGTKKTRQQREDTGKRAAGRRHPGNTNRGEGGGTNGQAAQNHGKTEGEQRKTSGRATTHAKHEPGSGGRDNRRRQKKAKRRRATARLSGNKRKRGAGNHRPRNANPPGGGDIWRRARDSKKQRKAADNKRAGRVRQGGGGVAAAGSHKHQRTAESRADTRKRRASKETRAAGQRHPRNKNTGWHTARTPEAGPSDPARTTGWRTTRAPEAGPSVLARQIPHTTNTQQRRPYGGGDNREPTKQAEHRAGSNTTNQNPNTLTQHTPKKEEGTHQHSTNPGRANITDNQRPTTPAVRRQRQQRTNKTSLALSRLQHHKPKPERADTARPIRVGGHAQTRHAPTGRAHAPAEHQPRPGKHHRQPTPDNPGSTAAETTANHQNKLNIEPATTPRTEARTRQHSTPNQWGGQAQTRHAPTGGGGARTSTTPTPARQTTQPQPQPTPQTTTT